MSYTPNEWQRVDVVTSEKLNHMEQGIAEGGIGYYDKTTLLNETIPVADWVDKTMDAYAEIDVTGIELSADKTYWIVIDGVATKCDYGEEDSEWFIVPIDPDTQFPAIGMNASDNYSLFLAELPTEPVSFQLIEGEAHKISNDFLQASGGDSYDLEILCNKTPTSASDISDFEIISGNIETIEEKITNGEFSKAIVYFLANPTPSTGVFHRCELILFDIGYRLMEFAYKDGAQLLIYYTSDYELSSFSFSAV